MKPSPWQQPALGSGAAKWHIKEQLMVLTQIGNICNSNMYIDNNLSAAANAAACGINQTGKTIPFKNCAPIHKMYKMNK